MDKILRAPRLFDEPMTEQLLCSGTLSLVIVITEIPC